jgi:hypothetical protein
MAKNIGVLCTAHCSFPECRADGLKSRGERSLNWLRDKSLMISRCKKPQSDRLLGAAALGLSSAESPLRALHSVYLAVEQCAQIALRVP